MIRQQFVRVGEARGDFVAITQGLKAGETVVSTGVFKLRNGMTVTINNDLAPNPQVNPKPRIRDAFDCDAIQPETRAVIQESR